MEVGTHGGWPEDTPVSSQISPETELHSRHTEELQQDFGKIEIKDKSGRSELILSLPFFMHIHVVLKGCKVLQDNKQRN